MRPCSAGASGDEACCAGSRTVVEGAALVDDVWAFAAARLLPGQWVLRAAEAAVLAPVSANGAPASRSHLHQPPAGHMPAS